MSSGVLVLDLQFWKNRRLNNPDLTYKTNTANKEEILAHLQECNDNFSQPLNQKVDIGVYSRKLFKKSIMFEAWTDKTLVGLVAAYFNDTENSAGYVTNVSITKNLQGMGIASELLKRCIEYAKQNNFDEIKLEVSHNNHDAIHLYEKFGFINYAEKDDSLVLRLCLQNF